MPHAGMQPGALGLETTAWNATVGLPYCDEQPMPVNEFRWGLAATAGALHFLHIDCEGLGTFIDVKCGEKIFFVPRPNILSHPSPSRDGHDTFGNLELFLEDYSPENPVRSLWSVEAILLSAGSRMCAIPTMCLLLRLTPNRILRPNTPHAVFTPSNSICHGGHFYSKSTIRDTFYGIVHTFIVGKVATNATHHSSRVFIRRILQFYKKGLVDQAYQNSSKRFLLLL